MSLLYEYIDRELQSDLVDAEYAKDFLENFISKYPREDIMDISMNDFLFAPEGWGYDNTFCRLLMYSPLASMGDNRPGMFGIYLKGGTELKLSSTYSFFGSDFDSAFEEIKKNIIDLLDAARDDDYEAIDRCKLHSSFKCILLAIYYPDIYLPAIAKKALDGYCEALGYSFPSGTTMAYKNRTLVEWKKTVPECKEWNNFILMRFCDWLWRSHLRIDGYELTENVLLGRMEDIREEIDELDLMGETREAVVKVRINQSEFRERLLGKYEHCCLCGVKNPALLIASHIKPWVISNSKEKIDLDNGFLLCPNHDRLFDKGFISFNNNGEIMISKSIDKNDQIFMNVSDTMKIELTEKNKGYLEYHRDNIFQQ